MTSGRFALCLLLVAALSGCGFRPVYAPNADGTAGPAAQGMAEITVGVMPERYGQLVRQSLQQHFDRGGGGLAHRYDLTVSVGLNAEAIGIQPDSAASRLRFVSTASWTLTAQDVQRSTLTSGTARVVDGLNVLDQQFFAADLESESVQRRMADALAEKITLQLAVFFNKRAAGG